MCPVPRDYKKQFAGQQWEEVAAGRCYRSENPRCRFTHQRLAHPPDAQLASSVSPAHLGETEAHWATTHGKIRSVDDFVYRPTL